MEWHTEIKSAKLINFSDKRAINRKIESFCKKYNQANIEHALVITTGGIAYELSGIIGAVDPEIIGVEQLEGSIIVHNHPIILDGRGDSFSREDLVFAAKHKMGRQYLISGSIKHSFLYTGTLTADEIGLAYDNAFKKIMEKAFNGEIEVVFEQEEVMCSLTKTLKGFEFYERF